MLEVILASTIFAIAASALFVTFRTGVRTWQFGHAASETYQTARITEDMLIRDLRNVAFRTESDYNRTFRSQVEKLSELLAYAEEAEEQQGVFGGDDEDAADRANARPLPPQEAFLDLTTMATPIDLTFSGEDGELLDTLDFSRYQRPRSSDEADPSGLRRIRYYVEEGTLYREESSIDGFRPGSDLIEHFERTPEKEQIAKLFFSSGEGLDDIESLGGGLFEEEPLDPLVDRGAVSEPLCEGVVIFDISYGYFRFNQWNEVESWDSNLYQYRFPDGEAEADPIEREGTTSFEATGGQASFTESGFRPRPRRSSQLAMVNGRRQRFTPRPDNLPGYLAIQLGLRDPIREGKIQSFTFFVSMPLAREEFDTTSMEEPDREGLARPTVADPPGNEVSLFVQ